MKGVYWSPKDGVRSLMEQNECCAGGVFLFGSD